MQLFLKGNVAQAIDGLPTPVPNILYQRRIGLLHCRNFQSKNG